MKFDLSAVARPNIFNLKPYSSARDEFSGEAKIFLDANENPYPTGYNRYPDPLQWAVKEKLAQIKMVQKEQLILGNGSDEIIDLLIRSFCEPHQDEILILPPTYGMYEVYANINAVNLKAVPLTSEFELDGDKVLAAVSPKTKLIFLCSPNNPSGNSLQPDAIKRILVNFPGIVIVDEAYIDFSEFESWASFLDIYPNLFVMQTLSKAWGLAGIRLGFGIANIPIIQLLNKVKPPYNISQLTQEKALAALENFEEVEDKVQVILRQRLWLEDALSQLKTVSRCYPSDANFILVKIENATKRYQELIEAGIVVRNRSTVMLCEDCLRITIGTPEENKALVEALQKLEG